MKVDRETVGEKVKDMRRARVWTQDDLARRAGVGVATIVRVERDYVYPHPNTIRKIAQGLGVDAEYLVS